MVSRTRTGRARRAGRGGRSAVPGRGGPRAVAARPLRARIHRRHAARRRLRPLQPVCVRAETIWRPLAVVALLVATAAAVLLYANRELAGDLFWLLAAGGDVDAHGAGADDPFLT